MRQTAPRERNVETEHRLFGKTVARSPWGVGAFLFALVIMAAGFGWLDYRMTRIPPAVSPPPVEAVVQDDERVFRLEGDLVRLQEELQAVLDLVESQRALLEVQNEASDQARLTFESSLEEMEGLVGQHTLERDEAFAKTQHTEGRLAEASLELQNFKESVEDAEGRASRALDERNHALGEVARLRTQFIEAQEMLESLRSEFRRVGDSLEERRPSLPLMEVSDGGQVLDLIKAVNEALRNSGTERLTIAEIGGIEEGEMRDVLVVHRDDLGATTAVVPIARLSFHSVNGHVRLSALGEVSDETRDFLQTVDLPTFDPAHWQEIGLAVVPAVTVLRVTQALQDLIAPFGYRVVSLGGVSGTELREVLLKEEDERGGLVRTLRADRAYIVKDGPRIQFEGGSVTVDGEERDFFRDTFSLLLPGSDVEAFAKAFSGALQ